MTSVDNRIDTVYMTSVDNRIDTVYNFAGCIT
jgi:hypothetical protein